MMDDLESLISEAVTAAGSASTTAALREVEAALLGKTAPLSTAKKQLGSLPVEERKNAGRALNEARSRSRLRSKLAAPSWSRPSGRCNSRPSGWT